MFDRLRFQKKKKPGENIMKKTKRVGVLYHRKILVIWAVTPSGELHIS